jgi:hypothetical protein
LKIAQSTLQKTNNKWTKKSGKGYQEWDKACKVDGLPLHKLKTLMKTRFASKVMFFQKKLEFENTINIYYYK